MDLVALLPIAHGPAVIHGMSVTVSVGTVASCCNVVVCILYYVVDRLYSSIALACQQKVTS